MRSSRSGSASRASPPAPRTPSSLAAALRWRLIVLALGCAAGAVNAIGFATPAPWGDELATRSAAERSLPELLRMVTTQVDAVHAVYYALMHAVVALGGTSVAVLRAPSVVAVGLAASGVAVLGGRLVRKRLGVLAAIVFAITPQVSWAATEARSSALVVAAAVWLTVLLVGALQQGRGAWAGWTVLAAAAIALNVYSALLVAAQVLAIVLVPSWRRRSARPAVVCSAVAAAAASPVIVTAVAQAKQVGWLTPFNPGTVRQVVQHQWFGDAVGFAVVAWATILAVAVIAIRRPWSRPERRAVVLAACCAFIPTGVLIAVTLLVKPVYAPRYTAMSLPFVALLVALPLARIRRTSAVIASLLVLALLSAPTFVAQRTATAKGVDWNGLEAALRSSVDRGEPIWINGRDLLSFRIVAQSTLRTHPDVALAEDHRTNGMLFDSVEPDAVAAARAAPYRRIVVVADPSGWHRSRWLADLRARGFRVIRSTAIAGAPGSVDDAVLVQLARSAR